MIFTQGLVLAEEAVHRQVIFVVVMALRLPLAFLMVTTHPLAKDQAHKIQAWKKMEAVDP